MPRFGLQPETNGIHVVAWRQHDGPGIRGFEAIPPALKAEILESAAGPWDDRCDGHRRSGTLHAWEQEGVAPDIQAVAKGLGGGYQPIGGILVATRVVSALASGVSACTTLKVG